MTHRFCGGAQFPKAIFFDLDDTILAFSAAADPAWRSVCGRLAPRAADHTPEALFEAIRASGDWFWADPERHRRGRLDLRRARREIVASAFQGLGIRDPDLATEVADAYTLEREEAVAPLPGSIETLEKLVEQGVPLALITNGSGEVQRWKIDRFGLSGFFRYILVEGEFGVGKPDERVFLRALEELEVQAPDSWMVGDNLEWDVQAPQRLGIYAIWVDGDGKGLPEGAEVKPDRIVKAITELLE